MINKFDKEKLKRLFPNSNEIKKYKNSLFKLNENQWEASIGLMLGDASIQTQNKGKTYRLKFEWSDKNLIYVQHVHNLFDEWVISKPHKKKRISPKGNLVINWGFQTISHEVFNKLADLFVNEEKKKFFSLNLIKNYLTARGLAYWFMDDGGKLDYNPQSKNKCIVLNTQNFTAKEVSMMAKELDEKFKLDCELRSNKGKRVIVIKNYDNFLFLTNSYIIQSMKYKLPSSLRTQLSK